MNYTELKKLLPNSIHIYQDITQEELDSVPCAIYLTYVGDAVYIGTEMPIEDFADREIIPTEEELVAETLSDDSVVEEPVIVQEIVTPTEEVVNDSIV